MSFNYPTYAPNSPSAAPTYEWPQDDSSLQGMLLVMMFAAGIFTVGLTYSYAMQTATTQTTTFKGYLMQILALYAIILTLLSAALMLQWASNNNTKLDYGYLGVPDYSTNLFAYHPLLMVLGFFLFQIFAVLSWYIVPSYLLSKVSHFALHTAALVCMSQSLQCIRKFCIDKKVPPAITLHSWIGIIGVTLFLFNYAYGCYMALHRMATNADTPGPLLAFTQTDLMQYLSRHLKANILWFKLYHKLSGGVVLVFTALAIVTGISLRMAVSCRYIGPDGYMAATPEMVNNPGNYYANIPLSCKTANGLGVSVILCTACMIAFVVLRNLPDTFVPSFPDGDEAEKAAAPDDVVWTDNALSKKSTLSVYRNSTKIELGVKRPSVAL